MKRETLIIVRGAGDLASGTILKLHNIGYDVVALECEKPSAIRRHVAFSEAVYQNEMTIEGVTARLASTVEEIEAVLNAGKIPVVVDPKCRMVEKLQPFALVDAILAKRNLGTRKEMAPITVGLGPGFCAGKDVHAVVETMRGAHLGRIYYQGEAIPNTGIPGKIAGYDKERVQHSPCAGIFHNRCEIGDIVSKGDVIAYVDDTPVYTEISGVVRGMLPDGFAVTKGFKVADVDPRMEQLRNIDSVSDKARCIAGGAVEAILHLKHKMQVNERMLERTGVPDGVSAQSSDWPEEIDAGSDVNGDEWTVNGKFLLDILKIDPKKHRIISVVGAGGKTSLIYRLACELRVRGYRPAITTTTHIQSEGRFGFEPIGTACEEGKLRALPKEEFENLVREYDVVLVEADGSRHHPLKVPADYEPVIPEETDLVIGVAGTYAIGQTFAEGCHRWELACTYFGVHPQDRITKQHLEMILNSEHGQKKHVTCEYRTYINDGMIPRFTD